MDSCHCNFCSREENAFSIKIAAFTLLNFCRALPEVYSMFVPQEIDSMFRNGLKKINYSLLGTLLTIYSNFTHARFSPEVLKKGGHWGHWGI